MGHNPNLVSPSLSLQQPEHVDAKYNGWDELYQEIGSFCSREKKSKFGI